MYFRNALIKVWTPKIFKPESFPRRLPHDLRILDVEIANSMDAEIHSVQNTSISPILQ